MRLQQSDFEVVSDGHYKVDSLTRTFKFTLSDNTKFATKFRANLRKGPELREDLHLPGFSLKSVRYPVLSS